MKLEEARMHGKYNRYLQICNRKCLKPMNFPDFKEARSELEQEKKNKRKKWWIIYSLFNESFIYACVGFGFFWVLNLVGYNVFFSIFMGMIFSALLGKIISIFSFKDKQKNNKQRGRKHRK